jgi:D-sedoheptulose 7-phosphate isomerase
MTENALSIVDDYAEQGINLRREFFAVNKNNLLQISRSIAISLVHGGKVLLCGNGGSAADAQHLAAEFVNRFQMERPPLPALALTTDTSVLTAIGNDESFEHIFSKQIKALAKERDVLLALSTSGKSPNVLQALEGCAEKGLVCVGLTGIYAKEMQDRCDFLLRVPSQETPLVQEIHIAAGHTICRLVDYFLFDAVHELEPYV